MSSLEIAGLLLLALLVGAAWREVAWRLRRRQLEQAAISRSRSVLGGKFAEQLAPFLPDFPGNPTEACFLGSPIDLVVFPGLATGEPRENLRGSQDRQRTAECGPATAGKAGRGGARALERATCRTPHSEPLNQRGGRYLAAPNWGCARPLRAAAGG